ncbi:hypothetical protein V865_002190 [Kwoniella europaea PYCC6329]|uniref:Ribosome assembly protein 3 n=1 Tax=Kwoniella europaea PYCC6329 TaxID=1423913 RepID=A0AAX4KDJ2_9TREE
MLRPSSVWLTALRKQAFTSESLATFRARNQASSATQDSAFESSDEEHPTGRQYYQAAGSTATKKMDEQSQEDMKSASTFVKTVLTNLAKTNPEGDDASINAALTTEAAKFK